MGHKLLKSFCLIFIFIVFSTHAFGQEVFAKVNVNAVRVNSTVDKKIFVTLQNQLTNFINNRKWTNETFKANERIACSFLLNIESIVESNVYKASLVVQAGRPVHSTSYQSPLINYQDAEVVFKYVEYQPLEFNLNRVQGSDPIIGNLTACFAFYVYMVLGFDADSFSPKDGAKYFQNAQTIVNNAPKTSNIKGWELFDGLRSRYWLSEFMINDKYNTIHDMIYSYYRNGLDKMFANEVPAKKNILTCLQKLQAFNEDNPNSMIVQFLMQAKTNELIGIFKKADNETKQKAQYLLTKLDVSNAEKFSNELK